LTPAALIAAVRNHTQRHRVIPLSVLDLSPVTTATPGSAALHNSLDLARLADSLGYKRYWLAEHHNLANIASSSPDIMIGQVAAVTSRIRVGSGGVMLPNHTPLMVAERFKVLEALFPGRIDLGLGRAPGTDPVTSYALRARQDPRGGDEFLERFKPTPMQPRPCAIVATAAIAADSDAEAERIGASAQLHYVRRAQGEYLPLESPEAAAAYPYTPVDRERMARQRTRLAIGSACTVKDRLLALAEATRADELMITTMIYDHAARRHSYELLAEAFALPR
jgi:alkanesulfonate monooxygenase SsuD/methylene tetrahydromethanopterin reductase-like flavin-dependent oxidoreductase (luciferase family)